jgi:methyltransferase (TIGR00027 family)
MSEIKDAVGFSSRIMAAVRAIETRRPDRLIEDPLAALLAGEETIVQTTSTAKEYEENGRPFVAVRTRFFDDFLMSHAAQKSQVVILGAGMDTRAFRLAWHPDTHLYELDQPEVLQYKESILENHQALCHRHSLSVDLTQPWSTKLIAAGYQTNIPSIWLLEGVLYYLDETDVRNLLKTISDLSTKGSWLGADLINTQSILQSSARLAQYWHYGCDEPETLLATYGWNASVIHPGDEEAYFGRFTNKYPPRDVPLVARIFFIRAKKE